MPGLEEVLRDDLDSNFMLLSVEQGSSIHVLDYFKEFVKYHDDSTKFQIHVVSYYENFVPLKPNANLIAYNYTGKGYKSFGEFASDFSAKRNPAFKNILLIDDLEVFAKHNSKDFGRVMVFFKTLQKQCVQTIAAVNQNVHPAKDLGFFYNEADALATLTEASTSQENDRQFICDLIKTKSSGKVFHEQSIYHVINGEVKTTEKKVLPGMDQIQLHQSILTGLTTFKLTMDEDEQEAKRRLHLPYFNAQSNEVQDPEIDFFDDEDEEDEEI